MTLDIVYSISYFIGVIAAACILQYVIHRLFNTIYDKLCKRTRTNFDDELIPLIRRLLGIGLWLFVLYLLANYFKLDVGLVSKGLGIGSLGLLLGVRDSIKNVLAGVVLMIDKPFVIGNTIRIPSGEKGKVITIGARRTVIRLEDDSHLIISNSSLNNIKVVNYNYSEEV